MSPSGEPSAQELFEIYVEQYPLWEEAARQLSARLSEITGELRQPAKVEARAKTPGSVVGKLFRKDGYTSLESFGDLVGGRVITTFKDQGDAVVEAVRAAEWCRVDADDRKAPKGPEHFGYRGRHLDVTLLTDVEGSVLPAELAVDGGRKAEIQLHTLAENLWANTSHAVTYKREVDDAVARRLNRLVALCEIFDDEAGATRDEVLAAADAGELVAGVLDRFFTVVTGTTIPVAADDELLVRLLATVPEAEQTGYAQRLEDFIVDNFDRIREICATPGLTLPILYRPEAMMLFERLTHARTALTQTWLEHYQQRDLDDLRALWSAHLS